MNKELLWEKEKYQKQKNIIVNLELAKWGTKYYLIKHFLKPQKDDRVLDIGCGYGTTLFLIANQIDSGVGVDISKTAIKKAREISTKLGEKNISFKLADANKLNFHKESFDKIICFDVAEHMVIPGNLFKEIDRLLRPGGRALVYTNFYGKFCWGFIKEFIGRWGKLKPLWDRDKEVWHLNRFTQDQIERYFQKTNLKYRLVFKNHWLMPLILDITSFWRKKEKVLVNQPKIALTNHVSLFSKIQYFFSMGELLLLNRLPSEGVFILIDKFL